jgi:hypothetical protein
MRRELLWVADASSVPFIPYTGSTVQLRHIWRTRSISTIRRTGREAPQCRLPVTEAAAIRTAFEQQGERSAAAELRRLFPGITDNVQAR